MQGSDCILTKAKADRQGRYTLFCFADINIHVFSSGCHSMEY